MNRKTPFWVILIIILFLLPVLSMPLLLSVMTPGDEGVKTFVWIYPFYMLLSAWLAYSAYSSRPYITWILLILMALSSLAIWMLAGALPTEH